MTEHYNKKSQTEKRRLLRGHLSKAEGVMWNHLSRKQMLGYKFRRQYGVDQFVIDFYCPELKLAIEIDGDTHFRRDAREYDKDRQEYIENFGIELIRFINLEVLNNLSGVLETIADKIERMKTDQPPLICAARQGGNNMVVEKV